MKSDEELVEDVNHLMPCRDWQTLDNPLHAFKRVAKGARIAKPKHIFLIVGESIPQWSMDPLYMILISVQVCVPLQPICIRHVYLISCQPVMCHVLLFQAS